MSLTINAPVFIIFSIGFIICVIIAAKLNNSKDKKILEEYIKEEEKSNYIRKREIDDSYFVYPAITILPINNNLKEEDNPKLYKAQLRVINRSKNKMIRLNKNRSNRDIKNNFGINNFEKIITYEENFNLYIESLIYLSEILIEENRFLDAEKVLKESTRLGSEYLKSYRLLIDIYLFNKNKAKIRELIKEIEADDVVSNNYVLKRQIDDYILKYAENL